jgi:hypothetical protein
VAVFKARELYHAKYPESTTLAEIRTSSSGRSNGEKAAF